MCKENEPLPPENHTVAENNSCYWKNNSCYWNWYVTRTYRRGRLANLQNMPKKMETKGSIIADKLVWFTFGLACGIWIMLILDWPL